MNSLVSKLMVAAVISLLITNVTAAQEISQTNASQSQQVRDLDESPLVAPTSELMVMSPYEGMEGGYEMMDMEMMMEDPYNLSRTFPMTGRKVFIVPTAEIEIEDYVTIERDIEVMSLIFDRALKKPQMIGGVFTVMEDFFGRDSRVTEAIYVEGYGALFFLEVKFVLFGSSGSKQKEAPKEAEKNVDQIWKRAEQELYSPQELRIRGSSSSREYDPEKVENLKATLVTVLKHAANIKALKSDEFVVLTISGKATNRGRAIPGPYGGAPYGRGGRRNLRAVNKIPYSGTVVNIRAKKSDIDAYSKGELDFDKFNGKIQIFTHYK